jgi:hypothetical protein
MKDSEFFSGSMPVSLEGPEFSVQEADHNKTMIQGIKEPMITVGRWALGFHDGDLLELLRGLAGAEIANPGQP